jgi:chromate transporter
VARIGQHVIEDRWLAGITLTSWVATLFVVPFGIPLMVAGLIYVVAHRPIVVALVVAAAIGVAV